MPSETTTAERFKSLLMTLDWTRPENLRELADLMWTIAHEDQAPEATVARLAALSGVAVGALLRAAQYIEKNDL